MVTIDRAHGLRVVIFADDHEPAHVPVFGDGQVKVDLLGPEGDPVLVWAYGMKRGEIRRAMRLIADHCDRFLDAWRRLHG